MPKEINPKESSRATAYLLWMNAPNPMVTFFKTLDVTNLLTVSRKKNMKFNMLLCYCITKAAVNIEEFYTLPVGEKLMQYETIAVSTIVNNKRGGISSCDIPYAEDFEEFNRAYLENTSWVAEHCDNKDLSAGSMVIGTSAIVETELDGIVGMNTGIFNNPFISWGRYRKKDQRYELPISGGRHPPPTPAGAKAPRRLLASSLAPIKRACWSLAPRLIMTSACLQRIDVLL